MSVLIQALPTQVEIEGKRYQLNTGFRVGLRLLMAYEDERLTPHERQILLLRLLYKELPTTPAALQKALELGLRFLEGGHNYGSLPVGPRLYSFSRDGAMIFSGILSCHGVDLSRETELHWWQFCALFQELDENCTFSRIICLRRRLMQGKATPEERRLASVLGSITSPPAYMGSPAQEAQAQEFFRLLWEERPEKEEKDV